MESCNREDLEFRKVRQAMSVDHGSSKHGKLKELKEETKVGGTDLG